MAKMPLKKLTLPTSVNNFSIKSHSETLFKSIPNVTHIFVNIKVKLFWPYCRQLLNFSLICLRNMSLKKILQFSPLLLNLSKNHLKCQQILMARHFSNSWHHQVYRNINFLHDRLKSLGEKVSQSLRMH